LGDLRGVKNLFTEGSPKIDSWISIDGGDIDRVNIMGLGSYRYRVTFKGPGGHSWGAFGLANPNMPWAVPYIILHSLPMSTPKPEQRQVTMLVGLGVVLP
jgi:di/tripeptidase